MKSLNLLILFLLELPIVSFAQVHEVKFVTSADGTSIKTVIFHPNQIQQHKPRPVVIALHGCGGLYSTANNHQEKLNARHAGMAKFITDHGFSIIFPDSFTTRGEISLCSQKFNSRRIKQSHRADDVDGVLSWLSEQSWVDQSKIALLGWSHGGSAVLRSTDANRDNVINRRTQPNVAVAFYPGCSDALKDQYRPQVPLVMMLAELDDWTPPIPCIELANHTGSKFYLYPDSYHDFDNPVGNVKLRADVPNGVNPDKGVHVGRNPVTGPQSWNQLLMILQSRWE